MLLRVSGENVDPSACRNLGGGAHRFKDRLSVDDGKVREQVEHILEGRRAGTDRPSSAAWLLALLREGQHGSVEWSAAL